MGCCEGKPAQEARCQSAQPATSQCCCESDGTARVLAYTESVCPECLTRLLARRVAYGKDVYLEKTCPQHGTFRTIVWRGQPDISSWVRTQAPNPPLDPFTEVEQGCPFDCGLCPDHQQQPCCVLLDVTQRCDLSCAFCFAGAGGNRQTTDPSIEVIESWYRRLLAAGGPFNVQLSGGEPCLRNDLPEIIALGKALGFTFFQVNTNGLRLSRDKDYLAKMKAAGLSTVFLQFDGACDCINERLRGRKVLAQKKQTIEHCAELGLGVVLVPTLVPGVNTHNIGEIIRLGLSYAPTVRGVNFQPASYFGRYPQAPEDRDRITIPEVLCAIEEQTGGLIRRESFIPTGARNALCAFHGNFVILPDGGLKSITNHENASCCCGQPERAGEGVARSRRITARQWSAPQAGEEEEASSGNLGEWDGFLARARTYRFSISGLAFQDAWNLDLDRLRECCLMQVSPSGDLVPFCAYNLTDRQGHSPYRPY